MKNFKKLFCMTLCVVAVLGMFAGCNRQAADPTDPTETIAPAVATEPVAETETIAEYTIRYELNGGELHGNAPETYTEESPATLLTPSKENCIFGGWFENEDFSGEPVLTTEGAAGDKIYYAKWIENVEEDPNEEQPEETESNTQSGQHVHSYKFKDEVKATCTENGYIVYECKCGASYTSAVASATGHDYQEEVIAPTTGAQGYTLHTCKVCGDSYKDNYTEKLPAEETKPDATEHTHSYTSAVTKPTCTAKGYTTYSCACGDSYTSNETAATGHDYQEEVIAPTTSTQGYTLHTCKNCTSSFKDNYVDKLPEATEPEATEPEATEPEVTEPEATEHVHDYVSEVVPPTPSRRGYTLHTCTVCGDSYRDNYVDKLPEDTEPEDPYDPPEIENHTHTWGAWIEHADGYKYRICPECGSMDIAW